MKLHIKEDDSNGAKLTVTIDLPEEMSDAIYSMYDNVDTYEIEDVLDGVVALKPYGIEVDETTVTLTNVPKSKVRYVQDLVTDYLNSIWEDILENGQLYNDDEDTNDNDDDVSVPQIKEDYDNNVNVDYEVKRKAFYDSVDDVEEQFELVDNNIPNLEQKLKQAGWMSEYDIYIPKGTQFKLGPDKWVGGEYLYRTIRIVGGPLDGLLVPWQDYYDEPCGRTTFIRKYCKRI